MFWRGSRKAVKWRRYAALAAVTVFAVMALSDLAIAGSAPSTSVSTASAVPHSTPTASDPTTATPKASESPGSTDAPTVICEPTPPPGITTAVTVPETTAPAKPTESASESSTSSPGAPSSSKVTPVSPRCGTVPPPDKPLPGTSKSVEHIGRAFPGAAADSSESATAELAEQVPATNSRTRELLQEKTPLPESMGGFWGEKPWTLPETDGTVKLDVTREGNLKKSSAAGPGLREYEGGEPGTRTVFQQLPGQSVRIYKVIEQHEADAGAPTELSFQFQLGCSGGGWFSSTPKKCSEEQCTGFFHRRCTKPWVLSDKYSYIGHQGITLIDPNTASDVTGDGTPRGFLTSPVARDANRQPIPLEWKINGGTVEIKVKDSSVAGVKYPVIVDPQWFTGRWLAKGALVAGQPEVGLALMAIGCVAGGALEWPDTLGQPWYRRVWRTALACLASI